MPTNSTRTAGKAKQDTQRDKTARSVREARNRLMQGGAIAPEFEYELLQTYVRNELNAVLTIPLLAIIIAFAAMFWAPASEAILWLICVLCARTIQSLYCKQFRDLPESEIDPVSWRKTLTAVEALYGTCWSGIVLVGLNPTDSSAHLFVFASFIVVLTLRLMLASTVMQIVYAGTIPMTLALAVRMVALNEPFYWALASLAVGIHIYFVFLAKGLNATVLSMLAYRAEKDILIAELEEEKSISDEARRRAEDANIAKSRFLATMSHELRTPLNAILGFSEVMKTELLGPIGSPTYQSYSENIHASGRHLLQVINEILDLSRIEAGRQELHEGPVSLVNVADDCQMLLRIRADSKKLTLVEDFDSQLPMLWADEKAIRQICLNLLSNALKFTPPGGTVRISAHGSPEGDQILTITDNGPGIPAHEIPRVMQAFGQGSLAHETAEGGTGLGLPIVKGLVELHGGTFEIKSELRKGTQTIARFPAKRVLQPVEPIPHEQAIRLQQAKNHKAPRAAASRPLRRRRQTQPAAAEHVSAR